MEKKEKTVQFSFRCGARLRHRIEVWKRKHGRIFSDLVEEAAREGLLLYVSGKLRLHCSPSGGWFSRRRFCPKRVTLPKRTYEAIRDAAGANGISRGQFLRIALELYLDRTESLFRYSRYYRSRPADTVRCYVREGEEPGRVEEWPVGRVGLSI